MPYTDFHYTPTGTGVISGKEVLEQTEDAINDLGGQISGDVQTAIDTANNALNTANTASADAQNAVNTANTAYTTATNAQNTANAAQNTASNALTAAQNAQNDVNALGNRVTTAENNITQNTTGISGLTTRMGTAENNISTLQNDVVTAQGTATSAQNTATLARGQAYVVRYASVAVSDNSSVPYTDLNNVDNIKANDLLLDTNGKLYQISSVDTVNETAAVTTPLTVLALDANVMHLSGNETASGFKTFDRYIQCNGGYIGTEFSTNARTELILRSNRDTSGQSGLCISKFRQNRAQGEMSGTDQVQVTFDVLENSVRTNRLWYLNWLDWENDEPKTVEVRSMCNKVDYRLTHINNKNPGALSFPDLSSGLDISGYITVPNTHNTYTPPVNGWISVVLKSTSGALALFMYQGDLSSGNYSATSLPNETDPCVMCCLPVVGNTAVSIDVKGSNAYVVSAKFYPNLGNV